MVTAIVPAYNEEKTIKIVLDLLLQNSSIGEVICVNDGSTDETRKIIESIREVKVVNIQKNSGKGNALSGGLKIAKGDIILFADADLMNFTNGQIADLISPLKEKTKIRVVIGIPGNQFQSKGNKLYTGERAYYREDLVPHLKRISEAKFGVETFLNSLFTPDQIKYVRLVGLRGLSKWEKYPISKAIKKDLAWVLETFIEAAKLKVARSTSA